MANFLFAVFPVTGHINPGLPIARELVARGHRVRWHSTPRFKRAIEATGARWIPFERAMQIDEERVEAMFTDRPAAGIAQLRFDIERLFVEIVRGQMLDLAAELDREPADVIVGDNTSAVGGFVKEITGTKWAVYGISALTMPSIDTAPFGLGILPSRSMLGRLRNRFLYWLVDEVIFRRANELHEDMRSDFGLPPFNRSLFDVARDADLYMHGTTPSFEYPRTDMPGNVRFIGASIPQRSRGWEPPSWWGELDGSRRVVLVTQGTINNDYDQLIRPAIRALAKENCLVVVTTGSHPPEDLEIDPLPANVRVERFIPYANLMPKVDLFVTNGGYGSIQIAIAHGVPVVAIGKTEEKPEIVNRVQWSGVGVGLKVLVPTEAQIREAVAEVMGDLSYRLKAEVLAEEMAGLDAATTGADLLEELAGAEKLARSA